MRPQTFMLCLLLGCCARGLQAAGAPDGTAFEHPVLAVDGPGLLRIKYCGLPLQVRLANLQFKGPDSERQAQQFLKETLGTGKSVKIAIEEDVAGDGTAPPLVQLFLGATHLNVEMVQRGRALSDGRSGKYGQALQKAQMEAMTKKLGLWSGESETVAAQTPKAIAEPTPKAPLPAPSAPEKALEKAPADYAGSVVADLNSKEYHLPGSRYAQNIRAGSRVEYKSLEEAERAGKIPSPFSFPDRAQMQAAQHAAKAPAGKSATDVVDSSRKALAEAQGYMQEAYKFSKVSNASLANQNYKRAAKLLADYLDLLTPIADARPNDATIQKLLEEMSTSLYSCNKYQTL